MAEQTTNTAKSIEASIRDILARSEAGAKAAIAAGYPPQSSYTNAYYSGVPYLYMYGDADQQQAADRMAGLYDAYGAAGDYDKTSFADIGAMYGQAGDYDPAQFDMADYTAQNIQQRMNPYEELVAARRKARLNEAFQEGRGSRESEAIRNQAFGGSGMAIREAMAERDYMKNLDDMNAESLYGAFESGAGLYSKEIADRLAAQQAGEASRQFGKQTEFSGIEGLMAARQQDAAQTAAAKEAEFAGLQGQAGSAQSQAQMAEQQKNMQLTNLAAMQSAGQQQEERALATAQYPLGIATMQGNVLGSVQGGIAPIPASTQKTSTMQNILGGLSTAAGVVQGLGGIGGIVDGAKAIGGFLGFADGGLVPGYSDGGQLGRRYADGGIVGLYSYMRR
jgi:hypothetical protein